MSLPRNFIADGELFRLVRNDPDGGVATYETYPSGAWHVDPLTGVAHKSTRRITAHLARVTDVAPGLAGAIPIAKEHARKLVLFPNSVLRCGASFVSRGDLVMLVGFAQRGGEYFAFNAWIV